MDYKIKYFKYKNKYMILKNQLGGINTITINLECIYQSSQTQESTQFNMFQIVTPKSINCFTDALNDFIISLRLRAGLVRSRLEVISSGTIVFSNLDTVPPANSMREIGTSFPSLRDLSVPKDLDDFLKYIAYLVSDINLTPDQLEHFRNIFKDCL